MNTVLRFSGSAFLRFSTLALAVICACPSRAELTARSYILDGLVAHWDGIENVSYGGAHDNAATTWTDLTGNGVNVELPSDASFENDGLATLRKNGTQLPTPSLKKVWNVYATARYTLEFTYDKTNQTYTSTTAWGAKTCIMMQLGAGGQWFGTLNDNRIGFTPNKSSSTTGLPAYATVSSTMGFHSFSCRQHDSQWSVSVDGGANSNEGTITPGTPAYYETSGHGLCFNRAYYTDNGLDGFYHAMRFYDRALSDDEMKVNHAVDAVRFNGADPAGITLPDGWMFTVDGDDVSLFKKLNIRVTGGSDDGGYGAGGTIRLADGDEVTESSIWCEHNKTVPVKLRATPAEGYAFIGWAGVPADVQNDIEIETEIGEDVTAVFRIADGTDSKEFTWVGGASGNWNDISNWNDAGGAEGLPIANDSVSIPSGVTVTLDAPSPRLSTVLVEGTLSMSNWTTCLAASNVTIAASGKVTVPAVSRGSVTNRVWISCDDLTIAAGGKIDVNDLGFSGSPATSSGGNVSYVSGPTKGTSDYSAAAHGGHGGYGENGGVGNNRLYNVLPTADDVSAPKLPGSGGYPQAWGAGTDGGGAVYISATRSVTVNGSILASVTKMTDRGSNGAGGSVLIECETFHGNGGVIRADGGSVNNSAAKMMSIWQQYKYGTSPGGGGMIAIKYDPAKQTADMVSSMTISAEAGLYKPSGARVRYGDEEYRFDAGLGTVYLTDDTLLPSLVGKGLTGSLVNNTRPYVIEGDFTFSSGHVRFPGPGASVTVGGNLVLSGDNVRLEIGGLYVTNRTYVANIYAGDTPNSLTVGGALTLTGGSRLDLRSAMTNALHDIGASLVVNGALNVETNCEIHCWSDDVNGGSPRITARTFWLKAGGLVSGFGHGFGPGKGLGRPSGVATGYGGAHGGNGCAGHYSSVKSKAYDDEWLPLMPGGGGIGGAYGSGGMGGGVVDIKVEKRAVVDGTIDVKGAAGYGSHPCPGSAGGTILIRCGTFSGAASAKLLAHGGNGTAQATGGGGGGGGRIAVWTGCRNLSAGQDERRLVRTKDALPIAYLGTNTLHGGTCVNNTADKYIGEDGTLRWTHVNPPPGMRIILR